MADHLELRSGIIDYPVYLPDATFGVVRSLDNADLERCSIQALVMNTYHLMQKPGSSTVQSLGGLHQMTGWKKPIITDSGGFQAYSLVRQNSKYGKINNDGIAFQPEGSTRKFMLTPEKCIQLQLGYGSDVVICLDDCTNADDPASEQEKSVVRTIEWARRCKREFVKNMEMKKLSVENQPKLFAVIQGGADLRLRKICADALLEIGFDGFGYGGWPIGKEGELLIEIFDFIRQAVPRIYPMHALGIGHPKNVLACYNLGYDIFDSAMPTRDARHGRLFTFKAKSADQIDFTGSWFKYVYIEDQMHMKSSAPISDCCDCYTCQNFTRGYLSHLYHLEDTLYFRLATIHNLRFMTMLTSKLREKPA
ncbi:MAG: tRNA guanosine(34) transglycosylase Tgt [Anaerolineaceae bacterium]|nr:tRNA guanosine(34) transglycosylase Tgt [Anaerolineaceae bacterium]